VHFVDENFSERCGKYVDFPWVSSSPITRAKIKHVNTMSTRAQGEKHPMEKIPNGFIDADAGKGQLSGL